MNPSLLLQTSSWLIALVLLIGMMLAIWLGILLGKRVMKHGNEKVTQKEGSIDLSSLTGLLFFLLAFTFGMSGARYETRKGVVVEEANAIGTALLRADLYPTEHRDIFRNYFKEYVEARIAYFEAGANLKGVFYADSVAQVLAITIWHHATMLAKDPQYLVATQQMIPSLNAMIDITTTRMASEKSKVPETIVWMLFALAIISMFFLGYASVQKGKLDWLVATGFCVLISVVVLITLDLDRPRRGFINLDSANQTILDLRKNFN